MKLKAKTAFKWAHQGVRIEEFEPGQIIETDDQDLIEVSQREGWTVRPRARTNRPEGAEDDHDAELEDDGLPPAAATEPESASANPGPLAAVVAK